MPQVPDKRPGRAAAFQRLKAVSRSLPSRPKSLVTPVNSKKRGR